MPGLGGPPPPGVEGPGSEGAGGEGSKGGGGSAAGGEGCSCEEEKPPPPVYVQASRSFSSPRQVTADGAPVKDDCIIM